MSRIQSNRCSRALAAIAVVAGLLCAPSSLAQRPSSPEDFVGHPIGADYQLVHWPKIVEYFEHLAARSDRLNLRHLGTTTEGRPMLFAEISSADTIANLEPHKARQRALADPRLIENDRLEQELIRESKVAVLVNCQIHSTETAASQMSMELAYELATSDDPEIEQILDRTIILLIPCANPDGQQMVAEWYDRSIGEPWEGTGLPWIYQKYAGHDNNRDWFMLNLQETRLTTKVIYEEWFPTIVWDVHQMGNSGARLFVPPFHDPKNQNVHPIIDQTLLIIGGHMAGDLSRRGKTGVIHGAIYDNWWAGGFRTTPYRHNMVGILTEAASVNMASPVFQRKGQLRGARRGLPDYTVTTNFPDPWPGGWWRLRDIVDYELIIAKSLFTLAARYHDQFQSNYIFFGREAIGKGKNEPPFAWLIPPDQRDPGSAYELLERLHLTAVEIHAAREPFEADGVTYPPGTFILYCAQPYRPHLMDMMERQVYPDRSMYPGGPAEPPYDMAGWTFPLQMGVRHVAVVNPFECDARKLDAIPRPQGQIHRASSDYFVVRAGKNDDYRLMSRLYGDEFAFRIYKGGVDDWQFADGNSVPAGSLVIEAREDDLPRLPRLLTGLSTDLIGLPGLRSEIEEALAPAVQPRTALYQPWTASMDEGWTRLVLENFEIAFTSIHNAEIRAGNLRDRYDCIVLPSMSTESIVNGQSLDTTAPEFVGGIGDVGIVSLQDFVLGGGTLVCIDGSSNLPLEKLNLPLHNVVVGKSTEDFYCPGSILRLSMDTNHPLGYGMPEWYSGYFARSQAFELGRKKNGNGNGKVSENGRPQPRTPVRATRAGQSPVTVVSRYSDTVLLESGWIRGGDLITGKPAIVEVKYGDGHIDLLGIGVQRRGQPHGTFRILFNAIQRSTLSRILNRP